MFKYSRIIACCLLLVNQLATTAQSSELVTLNKSFAKDVKQLLKHSNIPGAAYTIVQGDQIIAQETFGHLGKNKNKKVNKNTVFRLASVSKPFAATLAGMMANETSLSLEDPILTYVPYFKLATPEAAKNIKLHHLLSHTTGLMPNSYDNLLHENWSMEKVIKRFNKLKPICKPSQCYGYQNVAFSLIKPAIEAHSKKSYAQLLEDKIFKPLAMTNASVGLSAYTKNNNAAQPHVLIKRKRTKQRDKDGFVIAKNTWRQVNVSPDFYKAEPAAGVNASITDMSKWLIANLGHQPQVLSPELLSSLTEPRIKTKKDLRRRHWKKFLNNAQYGLGWRIYDFNGITLVYHSGWVQGFRADIGYSPELDVGFAILMNAEANLISRLSTKFWQQVTSQNFVAALGK